MNERTEGIRLAKRVAAEQACSRSEAEAMIFAGAVQVDGQVVTDPARRVSQETLSVHRLGLRTALQGLTVLVHQESDHPVSVAMLQSLVRQDAQAPWRPERLARLQKVLALHPAASGLCVFSDDPGIIRHLQDTRSPMEHEWLVTVDGDVSPEKLRSLQHPGLRASLNRNTDSQSVLRVAGKAAQGPGFAQWLSEQLPMQALHLQRIGRVGVAPLVPGAWRVLEAEERF